jgi:hypothetical protein
MKLAILLTRSTYLHLVFFLPAKIRGLVIRKRYAIKRRNYVIVSGSFMVHFNTTVPVGTIRSGRPKDKQYNGQKKKDKRTNNDLQNITRKTNVRATRTPLLTVVVVNSLGCSGRVGSSFSTCGTRPVNLVANTVINHE